MTLGLGKDGGEESAYWVCEKVLWGQLAAERGSHLLNLLQAPLFSLSALGANS